MATIQAHFTGAVSLAKSGVSQHDFSDYEIGVVNRFPADPAMKDGVHSVRSTDQYIGLPLTANGMPSFATSTYFSAVRKGPDVAAVDAVDWVGKVRVSSGSSFNEGSAAWSEPANWSSRAWGISQLDSTLMTSTELAADQIFMSPVARFDAFNAPSDISSFYSIATSDSYYTIVSPPRESEALTGTQVTTVTLAGTQALTATMASTQTTTEALTGLVGGS
tara:strand:+ start:56 stop:715 length:660 start_codon:yes stop_codon:yes gene_type:complete